MAERVAVAISGGIDSLFSAHLLKDQGYDVTGIHFISGYGAFALPDCPRPTPPKSRVTDHARADEPTRAAMALISDQLDIPIHIVNLSDRFQTGVVDYFVDEYQKGRTPNPCLRCNPLIKFGVLPAFARSLGIDTIATGHYARTRTDETGGIHLYKGRDPGKDQAYFLAFLGKHQLAGALFPLGEKNKAQIRQEALALGLAPVASKESQDVCFITGDYKDFLASQPGFTSQPGPIRTLNGTVIGSHQGLSGFTIGQRRGINCPAPFPYYVAGLDTQTNTLIVGPKESLYSDRCTVSDLSWLNPPASFPATVIARIRYAHAGTPATLDHDDSGRMTVRFHEPVLAVTPGQGAVFYEGDEVLGGGWIV